MGLEVKVECFTCPCPGGGVRVGRVKKTERARVLAQTNRETS